MQQQHGDEEKKDFKADSEMKSDTERERKKSLGKSQALPSRIEKVIEIKDEP